MDDYPEHLSPSFHSDGSKKENFDVWWKRVKSYFPDVPEEVARHWIYEHWDQSPYGQLSSSGYDFSLEDWPSNQLTEIRSIWCDYNESNADCVTHGERLVETDIVPGRRYKTAVYMSEHGDFPSPIIVLDNRDGFLKSQPQAFRQIPASYVLIEGHRRFNIALYLQSKGLLRPTVHVWLMTRRIDI
jgi:hypothetical protein